MSSTGRGPRVGGPEDFYATPSWCVRRLLEDYEPAAGLWLEPGAGNGSIIRAVNSVRKDVEWIAVEVREEERANLEATGARVYIDDFLNDRADPGEEIALVIGNPPFAHAQQFIERASEAAPNAEVALLLRLNYVGSEQRAEFMRSRAPDIRSLPNRPSFFLRLTDSIEYGWLIWPPPALALRRTGTFRVLRPTSIEERQRDMPEVGTCSGACTGTGWLSKEGLPAQKKSAYADHPCPACLGFGKVVVGPSEVEKEWRAAA